MHSLGLRGKLADWHSGAQAWREPYLAALHIAFPLDHAPHGSPSSGVCEARGVLPRCRRAYSAACNPSDDLPVAVFLSF